MTLAEIEIWGDVKIGVCEKNGRVLSPKFKIPVVWRKERQRVYHPLPFTAGTNKANRRERQLVTGVLPESSSRSVMTADTVVLG